MTNISIKHDVAASRKQKAAVRTVTPKTKRDNKVIAQATAVLTAQQHYDAMLKIADKAATWHSTSYKKATDELYALLSECYAAVADIRSQGTAMVRELNKVLTANGITFNDGTRLETKVVRVVFGNIGKRAHIYARVLVNALEQSVKPTVFTEWLVKQGGVEAVRKQHKGLTPSQVKAQRVAKAEKALPLVKEKQLSNAPKADSSDYVLAVVQHTNGKQRIVGFCDSVTLIKEAMSKLADSAETQVATQKTADLERERRQLLRKVAQIANQTELAA